LSIYCLSSHITSTSCFHIGWGDNYSFWFDTAIINSAGIDIASCLQNLLILFVAFYNLLNEMKAKVMTNCLTLQSTVMCSRLAVWNSQVLIILVFTMDCFEVFTKLIEQNMQEIVFCDCHDLMHFLTTTSLHIVLLDLSSHNKSSLFYCCLCLVICI